MATCAVLQHTGLMPYEPAWALQRELACERAGGRRPDTLLLLEHPPVYTVGRRGDDSHWRAQTDGVPIVQVDRGGSVTYHGPGQLIGYPIFRLDQFCAGPKAFVHRLEDVLIRTLAEFGVHGGRERRRPGIWIQAAAPLKIASIGLRIVEGVAIHGFALNVDLDLAPFERIMPCGLPDCRMTSMRDLLGTWVSMPAVRETLARVFSDAFDVEWIAEPARCGR